MDRLKLLVISDLHATINPEDKDYSHLIFENGESDYAESFIAYARSLGHKFDALVCPGDIANQGNEEGFNAGWSFIHRIRKELKIDMVLCAPGNHDHQSRPPNNENPKATLESSDIPYPTDCQATNKEFLNENWCYISSPSRNYNTIILNTSAFHGDGDEYKHGKVDNNTIEKIVEFTKSDNFLLRPINLLICHHHPILMEHIDEDLDYESMEGGQQLIHKLYEGNNGAWLIIHGHKHYAEITYSGVPGRTPPIIFSAGSLSAKLYTKISNRTSNQFYVLTIDLKKTQEEGMPVGTFEAHERYLKVCWKPSEASNLPARGGFGSPQTPEQVARSIGNSITDDCPFLEGDELTELISPTRYFTPADFKRLIVALESNGLSAEVENYSIQVVGKPYDE